MKSPEDRMLAATEAERKEVKLEIKRAETETAFLNAQIGTLKGKCGKTPEEIESSLVQVNTDISKLEVEAAGLREELGHLPFVRGKIQEVAAGGTKDAAKKQSHLYLQQAMQGLISDRDVLKEAKEKLQKAIATLAAYEGAVACLSELVERSSELERLTAEVDKLKKLKMIHETLRSEGEPASLPKSFSHAFSADYEPHAYLSQGVAAEPMGAFWARAVKFDDEKAWNYLRGKYTVKAVHLVDKAQVCVIDTPQKLEAFEMTFKHVLKRENAKDIDVGVFDWIRVSEVFDAVVVLDSAASGPGDGDIYTRALARAFDPPSMAVLNDGAVNAGKSGHIVDNPDTEKKPEEPDGAKFQCKLNEPAAATEATEALVQSMSAEIAEKTELLKARERELKHITTKLPDNEKQKSDRSDVDERLKELQEVFKGLLEQLRDTPRYRYRAESVLTGAEPVSAGGAGNGTCPLPYDLSSADNAAREKFSEVHGMLSELKSKIDETVAQIDKARDAIDKGGRANFDIRMIHLTCSNLETEIERAKTDVVTENEIEKQRLIVKYNDDMMSDWPKGDSIMAHLTCDGELTLNKLNVEIDDRSYWRGKPMVGSFWAARFEPSNPDDSLWPRICYDYNYALPGFSYEVTLDPNTRLSVVSEKEQLEQLIEMFPHPDSGLIHWSNLSRFIDAVYITDSLFDFKIKSRLSPPLNRIVTEFDVPSMVVLNKEPIVLGKKENVLYENDRNLEYSSDDYEYGDGTNKKHGGGRPLPFRASTAAALALGLLVTAASSLLQGR